VMYGACSVSQRLHVDICPVRVGKSAGIEIIGETCNDFDPLMVKSSIA